MNDGRGILGYACNLIQRIPICVTTRTLLK